MSLLGWAGYMHVNTITYFFVVHNLLCLKHMDGIRVGYTLWLGANVLTNADNVMAWS